MGLRVPIFFGEISVNGTTPADGGTKPQPPLISCDGALNITDPIIIDGDWKLEVDGELVRPEATNIDDLIAYLNEAGFEVTIEPDLPTRLPTNSFVINTKTNGDYTVGNDHNQVIDFDTGKTYIVSDGTGNYGDTEQMNADGIHLSAVFDRFDNGLVYDYIINNYTGVTKHLGFGFTPINQDRWINQNNKGNESVVLDPETQVWDAYLLPQQQPV